MRKFARKLLAIVLICGSAYAGAQDRVDLVRVFKAEHRLQLLSGDKVLREFHVALGGNPVGHKRQEGDSRTPEGRYVLDYRNANSAFYKSFHVSYPNAKDIAYAKTHKVRPGGQIMIHGQKNGYGQFEAATQRVDWTNGCIALRDEDIDVLWSLVADGTPVEIKP